MPQFPESLDERVKLLADVSVPDISQRYRMQGVLGAGAQATVYQGLAKKNQRKVAIKVCIMEPSTPARRRARSGGTALSAAFSRHPAPRATRPFTWHGAACAGS